MAQVRPPPRIRKGINDISSLANQHIARRKRPPLPPPGVRPPVRPPPGSNLKSKPVPPIKPPNGKPPSIHPPHPSKGSTQSNKHVPRRPVPPSKKPPIPEQLPKHAVPAKTTTKTSKIDLKSEHKDGFDSDTSFATDSDADDTSYTEAKAPSKKSSKPIGLSIVVEDSNAAVESAPTPAAVPNQSAQMQVNDFDFAGHSTPSAARSARESKIEAKIEEGMQYQGEAMKNPESMQKDLVIISTLGQGASGIVYKAIHTPTMRTVAVKCIPVYDSTKRAQMVKELNALYSNLVPIDKDIPQLQQKGYLDHAAELSTNVPCPYVVSFFDAFINPDLGNMSMVMEFMDGGSLQDIIDTGGCDVETILAQVSYRVLKGLQFIHSQHQIHRDIKPSNLLINHRGEVKVSDFGIVKDLESTQAMASTFVGTLTYMSPERISGSSYGSNSDVWSLGLSILTCALGNYPLATSGGYWGILHSLKEEPVPTLPEEEFTEPFRDFIAQCLIKDPAERPSVDELLTHPFLEGCMEAVEQQFEETAIALDVDVDDYEYTEDELDENLILELEEICDCTMKHFCTQILETDQEKTEIPKMTRKHAKTLGLQLGLPFTFVQKKYDQSRELYTNLLAEGSTLPLDKE